jgi:Family of unknown function (DUF6526)
MSKKEPQTFKSHARFDPLFHFFLGPVLFINVIGVIVRLIRHPHWHTAWWLVLSLAALVAAFKIRLYALKVQDRVIRLEERLRLQALAPAPWHAQIYRLTEDQLIGLRFAADDEVVELAQQALEHNLNRKQIKQRIRSWRPDEWRV